MWGKRVTDIVFSSVGILCLSPIYLAVVVFILALDGRPVVFRQRRVGIGRRPFRIIKFRTMTEIISNNEIFEAGSSSRVTASGAFLRKTKLDELPQLFNVLFGEMSIVGPRPEIESWTRVYEARWDNVLSVRPGITDWAAINYRDEEVLLAGSDNAEETYRNEILPKKLDYYEDYVRRVQFSSDVKILRSTLGTLLK